jgi:hypothetical protein
MRIFNFVGVYNISKTNKLDEDQLSSSNLTKYIKTIFSRETRPIFNSDAPDGSYVKVRLEPFICFLDSHKEKNQQRERIIQYLIIIFGGTIPLINLGVANPVSSIGSAILGALIAMLTTILQYEKFHEKWLSNRMVSSKLKKEYYLWKGGSEEYSKENDEKAKEALLVKNCEEILLSEATEYVNLFSPSLLSHNKDTTTIKNTNNN